MTLPEQLEGGKNMEGLVGKGDRRWRERRRSSFNKKYRAWKEAEEGAKLVVDGAIFAADEWEQEAQKQR